MSKRIAKCAIASSLALLLGASAALAAGTGSSSSSSSSSSPTDKAYKKAVSLIEADNCTAALPILEQVVVDNAKSADAWNYLGFCNRKLGHFETALQYYDNALAIDPEHLGANEYMGELYLQMGQLAKAEERLKVLDGACFFGCDPYDELKQAIADYKTKTGS